MAGSLQPDQQNLEPRLDKARHVKYWTRCLKTFLPSAYTGNDSNRMYLGFFIICALDLLDAWTTVTTESERHDYIDWIYHCQLPSGGFRMWPGTDFGERANASNARWDPANVPATFFALAALLVAGDDFKRVRRKETLRWIRSMQRPDGSFGETLVAGKIEGGRDPRFALCATGIRYILRGTRTGPFVLDETEVDDIDVDGLVGCIRAAESFDGGIADESLHEPHAGYTFCSLGALSLVGRLNTGSHARSDSSVGPSQPSEVVRWLVHRQTTLLEPDAALDTEFVGAANHHTPRQPHSHPPPPRSSTSASEAAHQSPDKSTALPLPPEPRTNLNPATTPLTLLSPPSTSDSPPGTVGLNGRTNKVADTCYAFWTLAPLHILSPSHLRLYNPDSIRRYLLAQTQHPVLGGFGKFPGDLPDLYHSCLGLAALGLLGSSAGVGLKEVKEVDCRLCVSLEASERLGALWRRWGAWV